MHQQTITVLTHGQGLYEISSEVSDIVGQSSIAIGLATVFCRHTSCSLLINENADPDVRHDLEAFMKRLVPDGDPAFRHTVEGDDDMSAHIKTALTATSLGIPVENGRMVLAHGRESTFLNTGWLRTGGRSSFTLPVNEAKPPCRVQGWNRHPSGCGSCCRA